MNEVTHVADPIVDSIQEDAAERYVLIIDPETGEEVKVQRLDEFSQETEGDETTVH